MAQRLLKLFGAVLLISLFSCQPQESKAPADASQMVAEEQTVHEIGIHVDESGQVKPEGGPYFADTNLRYVLRFWDVGQLKGKETAAIYRVYTPVKITGVSHSENYTEDQLTEIYARRNFPTTEIKLHDLVFTGGEDGEFHGTNSETGQEIYGRIEWIEAVPHVIFTQGIKQDYLITTEDAFNNW